MRFQCQPGCTICCDRKGFVYLTEADIPRLAAFVNLPAAEFEARYVYRTKHLARLRIPRGKNCHFLREGGCSVHPAKPTQCRTFPFWPELLDDRAEWRAAGLYCPGIGKGPLVQIEQAQAVAQEMREGYPELYGPRSESSTPVRVIRASRP